MNIFVGSEIGRLRRVIVHRPGLELERLTPSNYDELLFDDVLWSTRAREEHDQFVTALLDHGVEVHAFADLLAEALDQPGARSFLAEHLTTPAGFGPGLVAPLQDLVTTVPSTVLAAYLIGGVLKRELARRVDAPSLLLESLADDDFVLAPLPNHLFQRDNVAVIYDTVSINPMATRARHRESLNSRLVFSFHPQLRSRHLLLEVDADTDQATFEGGDVTVVGHRTVLVGMSERSTPQGIEVLARALFRAGSVDRVIVVELPRERAFMHLDTAMTMVDRDAFSVFPYLPDLRSFTLHRVGERGAFKLEENKELFPVIGDALGLERIRVLRTPEDALGAQREQWNDANNFLALAPGVVVGYRCNATTNQYLADQGIEVIPIAGEELARGHGGPRCLTCPLERDEVAP